MNKIFCVSCGTKLEYSLNKPRFCSSCGSPTGGESSASVSAPEPVSEENVDIKQLKDGVIASVAMMRPVTVGDLINTGGERSAPRPKFKGPEGRDLLDQIQEECKSSRDNPKEVGE